MKRYLLARGDRAGDAHIVEGLPDSAYVGPDGVRVSLATVYMKTWCNACEQEGYISPRGPRHCGSAENRRQFALSGDVNACGCSPQPVFEAVRSIFQTITASDVEGMDASVARWTDDFGFGGARSRWIGFHMRQGEGLEGLPCAAHFGDGSIETGLLDANHVVCWGRSNDSVCIRVELLPHGVRDTRSVADALLAAFLD